VLQVAVKIQHPNLAERLGIDMAILMRAADAVGSVKGVQVNDTVAQFASNFYMQLDFRDEAENLRRFRRHFASGFWRAIVSFPTPIDDLVSQHVVVETFEKGETPQQLSLSLSLSRTQCPPTCVCAAMRL
jgi:predicted unusual protein kinase regulating ubiquinone biosynthesis (AarF/ABC1/UbiB family)